MFVVNCSDERSIMKPSDIKIGTNVKEAATINYRIRQKLQIVTVADSFLMTYGLSTFHAQSCR